MPKISVIVPVYKVEKYLNRCVDSILSQTFTDFELILVDDGSPDKCGEICEEYANKDSRIHVIHQKNGGLSAARNTGIDWANANSNSKWITFIDSDDWVHHEYLKQLLETANARNVDICVCNYTSCPEGSEPVERRHTNEIKLCSPEEIWCQKRVNAVIAWGKIQQETLEKHPIPSRPNL